jgi:hypothetical protein
MRESLKKKNKRRWRRIYEKEQTKMMKVYFEQEDDEGYAKKKEFSATLI